MCSIKGAPAQAAQEAAVVAAAEVEGLGDQDARGAHRAREGVKL